MLDQDQVNGKDWIVKHHLTSYEKMQLYAYLYEIYPF